MALPSTTPSHPMDGGATELGINLMCQEHSYPFIVPLTTTVGELRRLIQTSDELRDVSKNKNIRLICRGRLLVDNAATLVSSGIVEGAYVHVALTEILPPSSSASSASSSSSSTSTTNRVGGGGGSVTTNLTNPSSTTTGADAVLLMGFDRLRLIGLDSDDVAVLRSQFFPEVARILPSVPLLPNETETHRVLRAEEVWMRQQGEGSDLAANIRPMIMSRRSAWEPMLGIGEGVNGQRGPQYQRRGGDEEAGGEEDDGTRDTTTTTTATTTTLGGGGSSGFRRYLESSSEGTASSFMFGVVSGWLLGIIMLIFTLNPQASRRFKLGVCLGIVVNICVTIWWGLFAEEDTSSSSNGSNSGSNGNPDGSGGSLNPFAQDSGAWSGTNAGIKTIDLNNLGR